MSAPTDGLAARALARVGTDDAGRLHVRGKLRNVDHTVRPLVAYAFRGLPVRLVDKWARTYTGRVVAVAETTDGNVSHVLVLDRGPGLPLALSLATIEQLEEMPA
jgi:hypothetical protein